MTLILTAARVFVTFAAVFVFQPSPKLGIRASKKYPSKGISHLPEPLLLCSRFLSYCTRMNFELVLRCGTRVLVPHLFFVKSNGLHKKQTHSNDTDDSAYDFA